MWLWSAFASCTGGSDLVRDEVQLEVDGQTERWQLVWRAPPELHCYESDPVTFPCLGFAIGERGPLDLVRLRPGRAPEIVALDPLFGDSDGWGPGARVRRWDPRPGDDEIPPDQRRTALARRPTLPAIRLADYDHDGRATEFLLQTDAYAGHRSAVVVGLGRDGRLSPLRAVGEDSPLVLDIDTWAEASATADFDRVELECGDHGSDERHSVHVHTGPDGIRVERRVESCAQLP